MDGDTDDTSKDEDDAKNQSEALAPHSELPTPAQKKKRKKKRRKKKDGDSEVSRDPGSVEVGELLMIASPPIVCSAHLDLSGRRRG